MGAYLNGKLAFLQPGQVSDKIVKSAANLEVTNRAFRLYYNAYQAARAAPFQLQIKMRMNLSDAAYTGMGFGTYSGDLATVFQELEKHGGNWTETYTDYYKANCVPVGVANFLKAVDERDETLSKNYTKYNQYIRELVQARKANQWDKIGKITERIKDITDKSSPLLWFAPIGKIDTHTNYHARFGKWVEGGGTIHSFLSTFNNCSVGFGLTKMQSVAAASFMLLISKGVPIIGDVYVKAPECVPSLVQWARQIKTDQDNQIRQILGHGQW